MTAQEKRGKKPKQRTEAGGDNHDPGLSGRRPLLFPSAEPFLLPPENKGSDKEPAQVETGLTPLPAQGSGFGAAPTPHPSCLPPRGGGRDVEPAACPASPKHRRAARSDPAGQGGGRGGGEEEGGGGGSLHASCCPTLRGRRSQSLALAPCARRRRVAAGSGWLVPEESESLINRGAARWRSGPRPGGGRAREATQEAGRGKEAGGEEARSPRGPSSPRCGRAGSAERSEVSPRSWAQGGKQGCAVVCEAALIHNTAGFCVQYQDQPLERGKKWGREKKKKKASPAVLLGAPG